MSNLVTEYKNFLNQEDWDKVFHEYLRKPRWSFGHRSNSYGTIGQIPMYWEMSFKEEEFFTDYILDKICQVTGMKFDLWNVYAGGNTFGTSGDIHHDDTRPNTYTFLYHASPDDWDPMLGGKTIFYPNYPDTDGGEYYEFTPNSGLLFPSHIKHYGEPVTKFFNGLRVCIAFKMVRVDI